MDIPVVEEKDDGNVVYHMPGLGYTTNDFKGTGPALDDEVPLEDHIIRKAKGDPFCRSLVATGPESFVTVTPELQLWQLQKNTRFNEFVALEVMPLIDRLQAKVFPGEKSILSKMFEQHRDDLTPASLPYPKLRDPKNPTPQDMNAFSYAQVKLAIETEKRRDAKRQRERDELYDLLLRQSKDARLVEHNVDLDNLELPDLTNLINDDVFDVPEFSFEEEEEQQRKSPVPTFPLEEEEGRMFPLEIQQRVDLNSAELIVYSYMDNKGVVHHPNIQEVSELQTKHGAVVIDMDDLYLH